MTVFAPYLLKVILCSAFLYGYYLLVLRNRVFHRYNRFYLLSVVLFSIIFPLIPLPQWYGNTSGETAIPLNRMFVFTGSETEVRAGAGSSSWLRLLLPAAYLFISFLLGARLLGGLLQLRRLMRSSNPVTLPGNIRFVATDHPQTPFSFFRWLFWQKNLAPDSESGRPVLHHELVHIREGHSVDKLLVQTLLLFFWINPLFWIIRRELHLIHEFIADREAAGDGGAETLATMILQTSLGDRYPLLINPFFQQPIKRRLVMLQKKMQKPRNAYLGRALALPLIALLLFVFAKPEKNGHRTATAQAAALKNQNQQKINIGEALIDTVPVADTAGNNIREVRVNKNDTARTITIIYKDGSEEVLSERQAAKRGMIRLPPQTQSINENLLLVVDGRANGKVGNTADFEKQYPSEKIESVNVLKGKEGIAKYGNKAEQGVIEITTRKAAGTEPVFEQVEKAPSFPGGEPAWRRFLEKNLNASIPVENGAPAGTYVTVTRFKVAADGTLSDFTVVSDHGYGMEAEVMKLLQRSPPWEPALQNEKKVAALHQQKVTFVIAEEESDSTSTPNPEVLVVIDGKLKGRIKDFPNNKFPLQGATIESVNVLKGTTAIRKYGDKGKSGVIEIVTRKK